MASVFVISISSTPSAPPTPWAEQARQTGAGRRAGHRHGQGVPRASLQCGTLLRHTQRGQSDRRQVRRRECGCLSGHVFEAHGVTPATLVSRSSCRRARAGLPRMGRKCDTSRRLGRRWKTDERESSYCLICVYPCRLASRSTLFN